jgi:hypothetical protein
MGAYEYSISPSALHTNLVSYWRCETPTTATDDPGANDGALGANCTVVTGKIGNGYNFDGQNAARITIPDNASTQMYGKSFTWGAWVKITTYPASFAGFFGGESDAFTGGVTSDGHLRMARRDHSAAPQSLFTLSSNTWYYVTFRFNFATGAITYGRDNTFETYSCTQVFQANAATNLFGQSTPNIDKFQGLMDEGGLWSSLLSDALIDTLVNGPDGTGGEGYAYPFSTVAIPPIGGGGNGANVSINGAKKSILIGTRKFNYDLPGQSEVIPGDTIHYYWAEDFESATTSDVNSVAGMEGFFGEYRGDIHYSQMSIATVGGNKVLQANINSYYTNPTDCFSAIAITFPLGDTTSDAWVDGDIIVPTSFDPFGIGNDGSVSPSHKISIGVEGSNYGGLSFTDSLSKSGFGSWTHIVNTGDRNIGAASRGFNYIYSHGVWNYTAHTDFGWYGGYAVGDSGYLTMDTGKKLHFTLHYKVSRPGYHDGYFELFCRQDPADPNSKNRLVARTTGIESRSAAQGNDFGKMEEGVLSFFLGGESSTMLHGLPVYGSRQVNTAYFDNLVWYTYKPGAVNYRRDVLKTGTNTAGVFSNGPIAPIVIPPASSLRPARLLTNEDYTTPDTIFDVGNGKHYIYQPPSMSGYITKTVTAPAGKTLEYRFLTAEFGFPPDSPDQDAWVKAYSGIGTGKSLIVQYGRTSRAPWPALTNPGTGWHSINSRYGSFEIHEGTRGGETRGFAIEVRAVP